MTRPFHTPVITRRQPPSRLQLALASVALLGAAACNGSKKSDPSRLDIDDSKMLAADKEFVREPFTDQARRGVIRQHTLYDTAFEPGSATLSALGRRDLGILIDAMGKSGGEISVPRGSSSEQLHGARLAAVRKAIVAAGVSADRIEVDASQAGGTGVATTEALRIKEQIRKTPFKTPAESMPPINASTGGSR